jgi:uncharacterized protein YqgC (DUF456 family)
MDTLLIIIGAIAIVVGILGCILPVIPGPPISYLGLIALELTSQVDYSAKFLIIYAFLAGLVTLLDFWVPVYGTKKFGGTHKGVWGSIIGLVFGLIFLPPFGIIIGPFIGAVIGELISGKESKSALKAGFGSFIGFLTGTVMKLGVSIMMGYHFVKALVIG